MTPELNRIYTGDCLELMSEWPDGFVQTCITSPPYWGLRDYGVAGQIGLESSLEAYVAKMVLVFREVRRLLTDDGTVWINLGDCYAHSSSGGHGLTGGRETSTLNGNLPPAGTTPVRRTMPLNLKNKDMVGIPWRIAFALQADGWYLRSDIIWAKPNPMPESVADRPTKAHEYLFLLAKSERYFYDADAIKEASSLSAEEILKKTPAGWDTKHDGNPRAGRYRNDKQRGHGRRHAGFNERWDAMEKIEQCSGMRNKRSVWTVGTSPFPEAHFATFPPDLIRPCILAGSAPNGVVFDPFMGAGTTALVASEYGRRFLGVELNPAYVEIAERRIANEKSQVKMAI